MDAASDMLPTACFSPLPTFANSLVLLPQIFLRFRSLYMTLHSESRYYKVSHQPLRYCYKISVIMTHNAAIAHRVWVCRHTPMHTHAHLSLSFGIAMPLQLLYICTNTNTVQTQSTSSVCHKFRFYKSISGTGNFWKLAVTAQYAEIHRQSTLQM